MKNSLQFFNDTVKAGIFFVLPLLIVVLILSKVISYMMPIARFIESIVDPSGKIPLLSVTILVFLILSLLFLSGFVESRLSGSKKIIRWIENNILSLLPAYQLIKSTSQKKLGLESQMNLPVVLVPTDGWVIAFKIDDLANDEVLVFIPSSPNPYEGSLNIFKKIEIRNTTLTPIDAYAILRKTGIGTKSIFDKAQIDLPK